MELNFSFLMLVTVTIYCICILNIVFFICSPVEDLSLKECFTLQCILDAISFRKPKAAL